jgi:hypothetical protein
MRGARAARCPASGFRRESGGGGSGVLFRKKRLQSKTDSAFFCCAAAGAAARDAAGHTGRPDCGGRNGAPLRRGTAQPFGGNTGGRGTLVFRIRQTK